MTMSLASAIRCVITLAIVLTALKDTSADLQEQGCEHGWTDYRDYCYIVVAQEVVADVAKNRCESLGASLSSVWSPEEKNFITFLWEFPHDQIGFIWVGLRGSDSKEWVYDDQSTVRIMQGETEWSVLDYIPGIPADISRKCVALRNSAIVAFLDCNMSANAFVCKKALPKVFTTSSVLNRTSPSAVSPIGHVQLFERRFPPELISLPSQSFFMAEVVVATEVGCAFRCFSTSGCQVFQVSCQSSQNCQTLQCALFTDLTS